VSPLELECRVMSGIFLSLASKFFEKAKEPSPGRGGGFLLGHLDQ
jgi:hypothetical protein